MLTAQILGECAVTFTQMASVQVLRLEKPKPDKRTLMKAQRLQRYQQHHGVQNSSYPGLSGHSLLTPAPARWHLCLHTLLVLPHPSLLPSSLHSRNRKYQGGIAFSLISFLSYLINHYSPVHSRFFCSWLHPTYPYCSNSKGFKTRQA